MLTGTTDSPKPGGSRRHPLVIETERQLFSHKPGEYGLSYGRGQDSLDISVGRASMRRALSIFDRLIKRIEEVGGKVFVSRDQWPKTFVRMDGIELQVRMFERSDRTDHVPTKTEEEDLKKGNRWRVRPWDFSPSGDIIFEVVDYVGQGVQRTWTDGKRRKFSRHPERLFEGLQKTIAAEKALQAERDERHRRYEEERRIAEEARRLEEEEKQCFDELVRRASRSDQARQVRDLVAILREKILQERGPFDPGSPLDDWFTWAEGCADRLDPIKVTLKELAELDSHAPGYTLGFDPAPRQRSAHRDGEL